MANNVFDIDADESDDGIKMASIPKSWFEDDNNPDWFAPVISYGVTEGGILVPKRVTDDGQQEGKQTGSIVETIFEENDVTVTAGSSSYISNSEFNTKHYKEIWAIAIERGRDEHDFKLECRLKETSFAESHINDIFFAEVSNNWKTEYDDINTIKPYTSQGDVRIMNNGDSDHTYDVKIKGRIR